MFIEYYLREKNLRLEDLGVKPLVIGTWFERTAESLAREAGALKVEHWPYSRALYSGEMEGVPVSFVTFPVGAPGTVAVMEELVASGVRRFIGLGMAGSLQEAAPIGSYLLPGECLREDGTSSHYLPPAEVVGPDPALQHALATSLAAAGLNAHQGRHWTTDAIYREFVWKIDKYRSEGVLGVDMETSAMYAFGRASGIPVANVLVVSDELWCKWRPAFYSDALSQAMRRVGRTLLENLCELAGSS